MANRLFHKAPLEVRDNIYRLLLVKAHEEAVEFIEWNNEHRYSRAGLHAAILRTCKQAYAEGLSVLYEKNVFNYRSCVGKGRSIHNADPLKGKFSKIKHFKLTHFEDTPRGDDLRSSNTLSNNNSPLTTMRFLATAGCSLKTLELEFRLFETPANVLQDQGKGPIGCLAYDDDLNRAIATVVVKSKIVLTAKGYREENTNSFDHMANFIGSIKKWAITEYSSEARQGTWEIFVRTWVLEPATAANTGEVPPSYRNRDLAYQSLQVESHKSKIAP